MAETAERPVVVCVDDEPGILSALRRVLRHEDIEFLATEKPAEALDWVLLRQARLVIADQRMPGVTGLELLDLVKSCSPSTIRIMLTGQSDLTGVMKWKNLDSIQLLLRKPWDDEELKEVLRRLLKLAG
jgi:response regulator RpfG family c-di-GMP phosphodiesterase